MKAKRIFFSVLLFLTLLGGFQLAASFYLGHYLEKLFAEGTDCEVEIQSPWLSFFPVRGRIHDVVVRHRGESSAEGFMVGEISVRLDFLKLLEKQIVLSDLKLEGLSVNSTKLNSGFLNMFDYLLVGDDSKPEREWKVKVQDVSIDTGGSSPHFRLANDDVELLVSNLKIKILRLGLKPWFRLLADASEFTLESPGSKPAEFGNFFTNLLIENGILTLREMKFGSIRAPGVLKNQIFVDGEVDLNNKEQSYTLVANSKLDKTYFGRLLPDVSNFAGSFSDALDFNLLAEVKGPLLRPEIKTKFKLLADDAEVDSALKVNFYPFRLAGDYQGVIGVKSLGTSSNVKGNYRYKKGILSGALKEKGAFPQIKNVAREGSSYQTSFVRDDFSNLDLAFLFDFEENRLDLNDIKFRNFPTERILGRFEKRFGEGLVSKLIQVTSERSLINTEIDLSINLDNAEGKGEGKLEVSDLTFSKIEGARLFLPFSYKEKQLDSEKFVLVSDQGELQGRAKIDFQGESSVEAEISNLSLADFIPVNDFLPGFKHSVQGRLNLSGKFENPKYDIDLNIKSDNSEKSISGLESLLSLNGDLNSLEASLNLFGTSATLNLAYPLSAVRGNKLLFSFSAKDFPLEYFIPGDSTDNSYTGFMTADLGYEAGVGSFLTGNGLLTVKNISLRDASNSEIINPEPFDVKIKGGGFDLNNVKIVSGYKSLNFAGSYHYKRGWDSKLFGSWDLANLLYNATWYEQIGGDLNFDLNLSGELFSPTIEGDFDLKSGFVSFLVSDGVFGAEDIEIKGQVDNRSVAFDKLIAKFGNGFIQGAGDIKEPFNFEKTIFDLDFFIKDFQIEPVQNLTLSLDGDLNLFREGRASFLLDGDLLITNGLYENTIKLKEIVSKLTKNLIGLNSIKKTQSTVSGGSFIENSLEFDLSIRAIDSLLIETNILQAELASDILLLGTIVEPRLKGEIEVIDGRYGFQANQFEITNGRLSFTEDSVGIDPKLDIAGETTVLSQLGEEQFVRMIITGNLSNPNLHFSSDAGFSEDEIISLLGFGTSLGEFSLVDSSNQKSLFELFNPSSGISLEERIGGLTDFDRVKVETSVSPYTGEFVPVVSATRQVIGELDLKMESELGGRNASQIRIDYPLTRDVTAGGGWKSLSLTEDANSNSGSMNIGFHYRKTFPGLKLITPKLSESMK